MILNKSVRYVAVQRSYCIQDTSVALPCFFLLSYSFMMVLFVEYSRVATDNILKHSSWLGFPQFGSTDFLISF